MSCDPLFIIGSGRCGTTLVRSMLVAGGQIAIPVEMQDLPRIVVRFMSFDLDWANACRLAISTVETHHHFHLWSTNLAPAYRKSIDLPEHHRSLARILDEVYCCYGEQNHPQAVVWGDQSVLNTLNLRWIQRVFPQAKFLHLLRDGRDVVASMAERFQTGTRRERILYSLERWLLSVDEARKLGAGLPSSQYLEVRYEELVTGPETVLRRIAQFMDIEYTDRMLDYWKSDTTVDHVLGEFHGNLRKPVFTGSIGSWRRRLSKDEKHYVEKRLEPRLVSLGY